MRVRLTILFLLLSLSLQAEKHYVATGGGGAGTLVSPFATLTQVNAHVFVPGDSILFNRGNTFFGTLLFAESGTTGNPIYVGSYGIGDMPIITGFQTLSGWTNSGGNLYWATVTGVEDTTNMVTINGVAKAMGRYPDAGTNLNYESHNSTISITDNQTLSTETDWTGADLLINKHYWILERTHITAHSGGTLSYKNYFGTPYGNIIDGRYFFIQNDIRCLTTTDEWWHDYANNRLYVYGDPSAKEVKVATVNYLINTQTNYHDITIEGIHLSGSIRAAINIGNEMSQYGNNTNITIKNCLIEYAGLQGIAARMNNVPVANCLIDNNTIRYCSADAIYAYGNQFTITNNNISYAGMVLGIAFRGTDMQGVRATATSELVAIKSTYIIEYNNIEYAGYNGIGLYYETIEADVNHNYINYSMQLIDDGGGIYNGGRSKYVRTIENNIVLNTGIGNSSAIISRGIYLDSGADSAVVSNNVVAHSLNSGILLHSGDDNIITYNLCYDNGYNSGTEHAALHFLEDTEFLPSINNTVNHNKIIARLSTQKAFNTSHSTTAEVLANGTFDYNYYARPIDDDYVFRYLAADHTLAEWKALTGDDAHSLGSPTSIDNDDKLHFIYNATQLSTYYDLSGPMIDITGASYSGTITMLPYTGLVLIGNGTVIEHVFGGSGTTFAKDANGNFLKDTNDNFIKIIQ